MRRAAVAVAVVVLLALGASVLPAAANHSGQVDGNDTDGLLDLRAVRFDHHPNARWTFVTFAGWTLAQLWDRGSFVVRLDTRGDEAIDRLVVLRSDGRQLLGTLFRVRRDGREVDIGDLDARKISRRAVDVTVALARLSIGRSRLAYYWSATSVFTGAACKRTCFDRVPDEGRVEQLLPGASPSPTPTPTPTASPSPSPSGSP